MSKKRALLVGINYPGTTYTLRGCVNDVMAMKDVLQNHFGFSDITMLTDKEATTAAMLDGLEALVKDAAPGDILYFHYSGHGSQYPNQAGDDDEPDGLDEIICPVDLNWRDKMIRDDDLHRIFNKVPAGVNLTVTLDCCHSGSALDQENQYQPLGPGVARDITEEKGGRYLPPPAEVMMLVEARDLSFNKPRMVSRDLNQTGLLLSGCQSTQTSADAFIGGKYMGACTYYLIDVLTSKKYDVDYKSLVDELNNRIASHGFTQRPELNGSVSLFAFKFLQPMGKEEPAAEPVEDDLMSPNELNSVPDANTTDSTVAVQSTGSVGTGSATTGNGGNSGDKKNKNKFVLIAGAIAVVALIIFLVSH